MRTETETPPPRTRERTVDKREVFQRHALFHPLTPQEIEFLATYSRVEHFAKGTTIFSVDDALKAFEDSDDVTSLTHTAGLINPFMVSSGLSDKQADLDGLFDPSFTKDYAERASG